MTTPIEDCLDRREPPLPWISEYAAELESESVGSFRTDAGARTRSLATAADLFGLPAVAASFDPTLAAEAVGCSVERDDGPEGAWAVEGIVASLDDALDVDVDAVTERGRVPAVLDATERLVATLGGTSVLGGLAGPAWLADALLAGADADEATLEEVGFVAEDVAIALANAYLDRGVDGLVVLEPDGPAIAERFRDAVVPLLNVVDHYDAVALLARRAVDDEGVELAASVGFDAVTGQVANPERAASVAEDAGIVLGVGVPDDRLLDGPTSVGSFRSTLPTGVLCSTEWAIPAGTAPEAVHELVGTG